MSEVAAILKLETDLPQGWKLVKLESVCTVDNGRGFKKTEWSDSGLPIIRIQNLKKHEAQFNYFEGELADKHRVKNGDLLFAWSGTPGTSFGAHIWYGAEAALNQHIFNIRFDRGEIEPKYFYFALNQNVTRYVEQAQGGVGLAHITKSTFMASEIPMMPLDQQKRIVAKIEELFSHIDAGIASLKQAKKLLKQYRQSVLKAAVTGELTKQWREENKAKLEPASQLLERILTERRQKWEQQQLEQFKAKGKMPKDDKWKEKYKEPEDVIPDNLPDLPEEWIWVRLDSIAFVGTGMSVSKSRKVADPVDVAYLRVANVQRGYLVLDEIKTMPIEKSKLLDLELQEWDVLYNEGGDLDKLGRGWIWENQVKPCITQNHVFRASPYIKERNHSVFLSTWGNTFGQDYFIDTGKQTTNLASINKGVLSAFPTPLPPLKEQEKIIDRVEEKLSAISRLEKGVNVQLIKAENNKQSILATAFSGRLKNAYLQNIL